MRLGLLGCVIRGLLTTGFEVLERVMFVTFRLVVDLGLVAIALLVCCRCSIRILGFEVVTALERVTVVDKLLVGGEVFTLGVERFTVGIDLLVDGTALIDGLVATVVDLERETDGVDLLTEGTVLLTLTERLMATFLFEDGLDEELLCIDEGLWADVEVLERDGALEGIDGRDGLEGALRVVVAVLLVTELERDVLLEGLAGAGALFVDCDLEDDCFERASCFAFCSEALLCLDLLSPAAELAKAKTINAARNANLNCFLSVNMIHLPFWGLVYRAAVRPGSLLTAAFYLP